jgi:Family of unknown function (DUF5941)
MTVALLLAVAPDRLSAMAQPYRRPGDKLPGSPQIEGAGGRLQQAGVRQVEIAMCTGAADGLRAVAATTRGTREPVLVCAANRALATPAASLAALLRGTGTTALAAGGTLLVAQRDLPAVADAAEALAGEIAADGRPSRGRPWLSPQRVYRKGRVNGELDGAVRSLTEAVARRGVQVASLAPAAANAARPSAPRPAAAPGPAPRPAQPPAPARATSVPVARPGESGLVATLAVAPLASRIVRLATRRDLTPAMLSIAALGMAVCAAAWFAAASRSQWVVGSVLLCLALPLRQAAARMSRGPSGAAAYSSWLTAVSGSLAEYVVYASLAIGWTTARPHQAWEFATAAMVLLAVRKMADACYASVTPPRPHPAADSHRLLRLAGQSIALPAGERTLLIAVTAPVWGPRMALTVLIAWGAVALGYSLAERSVASRVPEPAREADGGTAARSGAR